jgi:hypothetical protein
MYIRYSKSSTKSGSKGAAPSRPRQNKSLHARRQQLPVGARLRAAMLSGRLRATRGGNALGRGWACYPQQPQRSRPFLLGASQKGASPHYVGTIQYTYKPNPTLSSAPSSNDRCATNPASGHTARPLGTSMCWGLPQCTTCWHSRFGGC